MESVTIPVFRKAKYVTLGCKLNFAETATIAKLMAQAGFVRAQEGEVPDVCVVNTCSVTSLADRKCRQQIRALVKRYPGALMVVTGCYAQLQGEEVASIPGVEIVLGSEYKLDIVDYVERWFDDRERVLAVSRHKDMKRFSPSCERGDRTRYFLKVQDGCDCFCTYCTIPMARGRSRCGTVASLVEQARQVAAEGGREIVITGVNIGDFGKHTGETLLDLLRALDAVEGIARYRISSLEPDLLSDDIIEFVASSRAFMPHFHIPLQCGSDTVLRLMGRRYDTRLFADRVGQIRRLLPDAFIGVDVMAGTRGETPECFEESHDFIASLDVQHLHVFPYSERPGTAALRIPYIVTKQEKERRVARLMELGRKKEQEFIARFLGSERPVLWEQPRAGARVMHGFTDNYLRVNAPARHDVVNTITPALLRTVNEDLSIDAIIPDLQ